MFANLPKHLAVTISLLYRGLYIDEFIVISFPSLIALTIMAARRRRFDLLALLSLGWYSLIFYSFFSFNITRYSIPVLPTLAIATALVGGDLFRRYRHRRRDAGGTRTFRKYPPDEPYAPPRPPE